MICIAFIHTIIASHVEDGNMKCSYNSWVAVLFRCALNIFMIRPQDGKLSLPDSLYPPCLALSSGEADQHGHFRLRGNRRGDGSDTQLWPPAEKREEVKQEERAASR